MIHINNFINNHKETAQKMLSHSKLAFLSITAALFPQTAESQAREVEEVVVSATKKEKNAQDVSVTVQALESQTLKDINVSNFDEYIEYLPNVTSGGRGPGQSTIYIRGMAVDPITVLLSGAQGSTPNVALYLDEQPVTSVGRNLDVYVADMERIEVLPGPQGTLYGASSQAGTVRLITNKPKYNETEGGFNTSFFNTSGGSSSSAVDAYLNIPLVQDSWSVRGVFYNSNLGGYIDNIYGEKTLPENNPYFPSGATLATGRNNALVEDDFNDSSYEGLRLSSKSSFGEDWEMLVQYIEQDIHADGVFDYDPAIGDLKVMRFFEDELKDSFNQTSITLEGRLGKLDALYTGAYLDREVEQMVDYTGYASVGPFIPYYICDYPNYTSCGDPSLGFSGIVENTRTTHEFRVNNDNDLNDSAIKFTAGIFLDDGEIKTQDDYIYPPTADVGFSQNAPIPGTVMNNPNPRNPGVAFFNDITRTEEQVAIFGEITVPFNNQFELTVGARYYEMEIDFMGSSNFANRGPDGDYGRDYDSGFHSSEPLETDDTITKISLTYYPESIDGLVYLTSSEGFRPGGFNRGGGAASYNPDYAGVPLTYSTDDTENLELGFKTSLLDGSMRLNGAFYWVDWTNLQAVRFDPVNVSNLTFIENAADAEVSGLELDMVWYPTNNLSLYAALSKNDSELTAYKAQIIELAPLGSSLPLTPELQWNLRARYDFTIGTYPAYWQFGTKFSDDSYSSIVAQRRIKQDSYQLYDLAVGIENETWGAELFGRNLSDERAELFYNEMDDVPRVTTNRPRNIGLRVFYKF